jgi:glycosyltransferase involved in cell wall biosynthesis
MVPVSHPGDLPHTAWPSADGAPRRRRLALVTPWPPEQTGVAVYSQRLARELARWVDLEIVVGGAVADFAPPLDPGVSLVGAKAFRAASGRERPDRVLYCMGNSRFHEHVYELLREQPGPVLLHDVQLTGFFGYYAGRECPADPLGRLVERVRQDYGDLVPPQELTSAPLSWRRRAQLGIYLTAEIQRHAERVFVHSHFALDIVERDGQDLARRMPVSVMAHAMATGEQPVARGAAAAAPLLVHMGVVSEVKDIGVLIEAFALLAARLPEARLVIAGEGDEAGLDHWRVFAREHAPQAAVEIPGHLDTERWGELLARADLAVQLRVVSNGEASGAVCDCLAAGIPTIVSDLGWMAELPPAAVAHVPLDVSPQLLAARMESLLVDTPARAALSRAALAHARELSFERVAAQYIGALALA